jgi:hypothetical protein
MLQKVYVFNVFFFIKAAEFSAQGNIDQKFKVWLIGAAVG